MELSDAAGLPRATDDDAYLSVTAQQYLRIWETVDALLPDGVRVEDVQDYVRSPDNAQTMAFCSCDDVGLGLSRLSLFLPLTSPLKLRVTKGDTLRVVIESRDAKAPVSPQQAAVVVIQIIELIRLGTESYVRPICIAVPDAGNARRSLTEFVACSIEDGPPRIELSAEDAQRQLIGFEGTRWVSLDPVTGQPVERAYLGATVSEQLRSALKSVLPGGRADAGAVAARLNTTKRSLQRRLQGEGTSFGAELEKLRQELAHIYLSQQDLRIEEIALLLGFRDPNSFYRAFQGWTGMTPRAVRAQASGAGLAPAGPAPIAASRPPHAATRAS
ncbi:MAG: helix-turn-helix transcriptional regulator [Rhodobacteraceae bacterium]|nr:helix-turn-helix transcriptional regulator [Paracoccaceae bacterium]